MKDTIIKLFNLDPSELENVDVSSTDYTIFVFVTLKRKFQRCPNCGCSTKVVHGYRERVLNHSIMHDMNTTIVFKQRRYRCTNCNKVFPEANPFAYPNKRISNYLVLRVMKALKNPRLTFAQVAKDAGISTSSVIRIFDRYAGITPIELPVCLCIDEVYAIKYRQKIFACVLVDMMSSRIYDLLPSRKKSDLAAYFSRIDIAEREKVQYICMDMYENYKELALIYFPKAKICVDSFHVIKLINKAFSDVRIRIMKQFDRDTEEYQLLKHYSWLLTMSYSKVEKENYINMHQYYFAFDSQFARADTIIEKILSLDNELYIAYSVKEEYAYWNRHSTAENAEKHIENIIEELRAYDIKELNSVARTLKHWKKEIVNSFDRYQGRRISNGPIESVNSRIKTIKHNGNGYKNFERFRKRVLYSLNEDSSIKI